MSVTSVHANRTTMLQDGLAHSLIFRRAAEKWSVALYTQTDTTFAGPTVAQPAHCAWSPEPDRVVPVPGRSGGARPAGGLTIPINTEESCPWCTLSVRPFRKLGEPTDMNTPRDGAQVFAGARAGSAGITASRFFVQASTLGQLLVYDSTGAQSGVLGTPGGGRQQGEFQSTDAVALDAQDTLYVLDNELRRVTVFSPSLQFVRLFELPWRVDAFWVLRDGRLLTVRTPDGYGDPITIHSARGEVIRSFGAPQTREGVTCIDCGVPVVTLAPSGYRLWLAWSNRYQLEEWDLGGRRIALLEKPITRGAGSLAAANPRRFDNLDPLRSANSVSQTGPGVRRIVAGADGMLWVAYMVLDAQGRLSGLVDILDPVRGRLVKTLTAANLDAVVADGIRSVRRVNEFGFFELTLERYELDHSRRGER
jgi:hypothetical protein